MTPTLDSALAGLPAKPRVHELSKRIGITNKELLAALAERGVSVSSASSSVPLVVATELIEAILGAAPDDQGPAQPAPDPGTEPVRAQIPGDSPGQAGHAINPLFLPPAERTDDGAGEQDAQPAADSHDGDDGAQPARSGSRRRRGGRSGGRRPAAEVDDVQPEPSEGVDGEPAEQQVEPVAEPDAVAPDADAGDADAGDTDARDADDDSSRGRRRRRGRRGRGRISENDETSETGGDGGGEVFVATTQGGQQAADAGSSAQPEEQAEVTEPGDDDADSDGGPAGSGNRRRRRRRRRSTGDETPRDDDPDNTVVHVREPRLSQASAAASAGGASSEVQGVRGSTRLEAKRQRRRDSRDSSRRRPQILTEAEFLARRESVERVMAVRQRGGLAQVALLEDGILVEHFVSQTGSDSMIGSVFLGKVQNVLPSMEAAFVDIGKGRNAVIYAGEVNWDAAGLNGKARRIETALSSGDTILAQVSKDPVGHKGARLTTQISLPGRFVVYVPGSGATGISRKLPDTERKRLKSIMDRIVPEDAGVIIRTAAEGIAEEELARDVERLKSQWEEITRRAAEKTSAPTELYAEPGTLIKVVRDLFNSDITRLVVDGDEAYQPVADYVAAVAPELADRLVRHDSNNSSDVFVAFRIDEQIAKALERKVHLPSGGSLVIDRTEAMTVVDVNTGKYTGSGGNLEETVTKNNLEAAEEIVRQLRLRDIGGIIVVDFIDMVLESNRELVLRRLTEALGRDRTRHQVAEVTSLGLVQMTRKRMGTGLLEAFSEPCPHCGGRGLVLHDLPVMASPVEDTTPERRSGKGRRSRGRDTEGVEEIVVPRVVEQAVGRRPDPRGPKPPPATIDRGASRAGTDDDARPAARTAGAATGPDGDEIDWIEAAARAGIAAAEDADDDGFEAGRSGRVDAAGDSAVDRADGGSGIETVRSPEISIAIDTAAADRVDGEAVAVDTAGIDAAGIDTAGINTVPLAPDPPAAPARRRGRRAAGRPAGAPIATTEPVDIIVREPVGVAATESATAPEHHDSGNGSADHGSADHGSADHGSADHGSADDGSGEHGSGDHSQVGANGGSHADDAPKAPPRRRRAASRPAGPSAGGVSEPVVVTVPAEQGAG